MSNETTIYRSQDNAEMNLEKQVVGTELAQEYDQQ